QVLLHRVANPELHEGVAALREGFNFALQVFDRLEAEADAAGVSLDRTTLAAEKPPDRLAQVLALDVPERQIHAGKADHGCRTRSVRGDEMMVGLVPDRFRLMGIHADQRGPERIIDEGRYGAWRLRVMRLAIADNAVFRLDTHQHHVALG